MKPSNIEDEMTDKMAKILQEEIDWEIMCEILKIGNWTRIETSWDCHSLEEAYELKEWCSKNLKDMYKARGKVWMFANERDAVNFALKWI